MPSASTSTSSRALSYLTERAEDAQAAVVGILSGKTGAANAGAGLGPAGTQRFLLGDVDLASGRESGFRLARAKLESGLEHERLYGLRTVVAVSAARERSWGQ